MRRKTDRAEVLSEKIIIRVSFKLNSQLQVLYEALGVSSIGQLCRQLLSEHPKIIELNHLSFEPPSVDSRCGEILPLAQLDGKRRIKRCIDEVLSRFKELTPFRFSSELKIQGIETYIRKDKSGNLAGISFLDKESRLKIVGSDLGMAYSASVLASRLSPQTRKSIFATRPVKRPAKRWSK